MCTNWLEYVNDFFSEMGGAWINRGYGNYTTVRKKKPCYGVGDANSTVRFSEAAPTTRAPARACQIHVCDYKIISICANVLFHPLFCPPLVPWKPQGRMMYWFHQGIPSRGTNIAYECKNWLSICGVQKCMNFKRRLRSQSCSCLL